MQNVSNSKVLFERAKKSLVGGVNSPVRSFNAVGGTPPFIKSGKEATIIDVDGNSYVDYVLSYGPLLLGHANERIVKKIHETAQQGTTYGAPTEIETLLAEKIKQAYSYCDKVRFVSSGTEAAMSVIRLARGATKRDKIIKFKGCYHGHADPLLVEAGSGASTLGAPTSAGVLKKTAESTIVLDYNSAEQLKKAFETHGRDIAAVLLEPVSGNMGVIIPSQEFIDTARELTTKYEALLVFDEVMCGFRSQKTGTHEWIGCEPDVVILGKVIGGGLPCGAYAAKKELMQWIAPEGDVYQAGTLSGNPLAMAAGLETLTCCDEENVFEKTNQFVTELANKMKKISKDQNMGLQIHHIGSMFSVFFSQLPILNLADVQKCCMKTFNSYFHFMLQSGIYLPPSQYEACFVSFFHGNQELQQTVNGFEAFCSQKNV